ncbi:MAG TPA: hypothetical protein VK472_08030, partial [Allosphingosinicella sp.]|nr:hypothetical protein [Allosphingosinicella sp.]
MALLPLFMLGLFGATSGARAQTLAAGSFEVPDFGPNYEANPTTMTDAVFTGNAGVAGNGSLYSFVAADGDQVGYIQSTGAVSSIALTARNLVPGTSYRVRFSIAKRYSFVANQLTLAFNGTSLGSFTTTSESFMQFVSNAFTPTASTGQLTVTGATVPNTSTGIDMISIVPASGIETIAYQYDARGRLVGVVRTGTVNNNVSTDYTY